MISAQNIISSVFKSLSSKYIIVIVVILATTMSIAAYLDYKSQKQQLIAQLQSKGAMLGNFVALISPEAILGYDFVLLDEYMKEITHRRDIVYSVVVSPDNINLTSHYDTNNPQIAKYRGNDLLENISHLKTDPDIINLQFPIKENNKLQGNLLLGISTKRVAEISKQALINRLVQALVIIIILSLSIILVFRFIALRPINNLIKSSRKISSGNLDHQAQVLANDELGILTQSFNNMTTSLRDSYVELNEKNDELIAATKAKSAFLANMSHEIRTPLTAIVGFAEVLLDTEISESEKRESIHTIIRNGNHLQKIINDILDISKIEADKLEIELYEASPIGILKDIEALVKMQAKEKELDFEIKCKYPLPKTIVTDPLRLKQILINLTSNAIKFTSNGKISIEVQCDFEAGSMGFSIVDTGMGLNENQLETVFGAFTQADVSTTREFGGTGLGLPLCKRLSEMLGGGIRVSSQLGKGSTFKFHINTGKISPLNTIDHSEIDENLVDRIDNRTYLAKGENNLPEYSNERDGVEQKTHYTQFNGHILLAEDTPDNQRLIQMYVNKLGLRLTIVDNGKKAVEAALSKSYDVILMDMQMPIMGGLDATKILIEQECQSPIIAITANALKHDRQQYKDAGCVDFIAKPINQDCFQKTLGKYLLPKDGLEQIERSSQDDLAKNITLIPISSQLDIDSSEIAETLEKFLNGLPPVQKLVNTLYENKSWDELMGQIHQIKGIGGAFGFPQLTDVAKEIYVDLVDKKYTKLNKLMTELNAIYERIEAGRHAA